MEQAHHNRRNVVSVITVCVLPAAEKAANDFEFIPRRFGSQLVVYQRKALDVVEPHSSAHHGSAHALVVGTVPLVANSRNVFRSQDRRNPANKCGTTNLGESPRAM